MEQWVFVVGSRWIWPLGCASKFFAAEALFVLLLWCKVSCLEFYGLCVLMFSSNEVQGFAGVLPRNIKDEINCSRY